MGFLWHPAGTVEAGIDGAIEIRDDATGDVLNNIVQVQSKATEGTFPAETADSFAWTCAERDLDYWMQGNAPVILVVSRPNRDEAYWVAVKDYFRDSTVRQTRKVRFDKCRHRFDEECKDDLIDLAVPKDAGIYLAPPRRELLYSNLLPVASYAERLYIAETDCQQREDVWRKMRRQRGLPPLVRMSGAFGRRGPAEVDDEARVDLARGDDLVDGNVFVGAVGAPGEVTRPADNRRGPCFTHDIEGRL